MPPRPRKRARQRLDAPAPWDALHDDPIDLPRHRSSAQLDHTTFPHIFDTILASCTTETLFLFRQTSRAVCAAVDKHLAAHIIVEVPDHEVLDSSTLYVRTTRRKGKDRSPLRTGGAVLIYTSHGRLPFFMRFWDKLAACLLWCTPDGLDLNSTSSPAHKRFLAALAYTKFVDLRGVNAQTAAHIAPLLPAVRVVRPWACDASLPATTMVTRHTLFLSPSEYGPPLPPPGVCKLVIHLDVSPDSGGYAVCPPGHLPSSVQEVVVVFHAVDTQGENDERGRRRSSKAPGVLRDFAWFMSDVRNRTLGLRYTLVGAHEVYPAVFACDKDTLDREDLEKNIRAALRRPARGPSKRALFTPRVFDLDSPRDDTLRFLGIEEYVTEVGRAQWDAEMLIPPDTVHVVGPHGELTEEDVEREFTCQKCEDEVH